MMDDKTRPQRPIPSALKHAGTVLATERKRKPKSTGQAKAAGKGGFVQAPVEVPAAATRDFVLHTRYLPGKFVTKARYAMAHTVKICPGADRWTEEDLWDVIGGWNSRLRGMKDIEGLTTRHHGQAAVQKVLLAMRRAESDPMLGPKLKRPIVQFVREALRGLDDGISRALNGDPTLALTPDEMAGMAPCALDQGGQRNDLFKQPKSRSRVIRTQEVGTPKQDLAEAGETRYPLSDFVESVNTQSQPQAGEAAGTPIKRGLLQLKRLFTR